MGAALARGRLLPQSASAGDSGPATGEAGSRSSAIQGMPSSATHIMSLKSGR